MGIKNIYERFLWFDNEVRVKKYPNTTSLAVKFEISPKTAQRDIYVMRDRLSAPLEYESSRKGYYYYDGDFSIPLTYLSVEELSSLLIAKKILQDISGGNIGGEISTVLNKITNILSKYAGTEDLVEDAISIQSVEFLPVPDEIFKVVLEGLLKRKRLMITYHSPESEEESHREIDPYHLFSYRGTWHLIAYCHMRKGIRDFSVGRIIEAEISNEGFKKLESFTEIKMEVLRHGDAVEVMKPKALRDLVREEAENILMVY